MSRVAPVERPEYIEPALAYFVNVYTVETWEQALARGSTIAGFPAPTTTRGGYFQSTFDQVEVGDIMLCYVKAPAMRWVGALRVESKMFLGDDDIWGRAENGTAMYPARFKTTPIIALTIDVGLPVQDTIGLLDCLSSNARTGIFRRSLMKVSVADGDGLLALLRDERPASPVVIPKRRTRKATKKRVKRTAQKGRASAKPRPSNGRTSAGAPESEREADEQRGAQHLALITKLVRLGRAMGCDVWLATDERGKSSDGYVLSEHTLAEFPAVGIDPETSMLVRTIDVLWINKRHIAAAFEVEATTSIYSGLLRMSDLIALQPNTSIDLYIVAPDARAKKVRSQILRPTFEAFDPPLRERCRFLTASNLDVLVASDERLLRNQTPALVRDYAEQIPSNDG